MPGLQGDQDMSNPTGTSLHMGRVALVVRDLEKVGRYYEESIGLHPMGRDGEVALYGAGENVLLELRQDRLARQRSPKEAGLFHSAFLLPSRADLGAWTQHAIDRQLQVSGVADHLVSEAIYLNDPEGNGIEIYVDRPRDQWVWEGGQVAMASDPLDTEGILKSAQGRKWQGFPDGTVMGHVHLQVGSVAEAEGFYAAKLGLNVTSHYPGAVFMAADGYHHHIAANVWNSRGAGPRDLPATGLAEVALHVAPERAADLRALAGLAPDAALGFDLADPWNTPLRIEAL